jgi:hypothetical protein
VLHAFVPTLPPAPPPAPIDPPAAFEPASLEAPPSAAPSAPVPPPIPMAVAPGERPVELEQLAMTTMIITGTVASRHMLADDHMAEFNDTPNGVSSPIQGARSYFSRVWRGRPNPICPRKTEVGLLTA